MKEPTPSSKSKSRLHVLRAWLGPKWGDRNQPHVSASQEMGGQVRTPPPGSTHSK